jgi:hypothetical protein
MIDAQVFQEGSLRRGSGSRDNGCADMLGVLDRRQANAAGAAMDQDPFAGLKPCLGRQRIEDGQIGDRDRRAGREAHVVGQGRHGVCLRHDVGLQRRRGQRHDAVADGQAGYAFA